MSGALSNSRRLFRLVLQLPETLANSLHYRVDFILPRWFAVPKRVFVADRYVALSLPENDAAESAFIECFVRNVYGLGQGLPQVRTVLDVGAHAGFFSLAVRGRYPAATIHAYEPNPRILPFLRANTAASTVRVFPEAIGGWDARVTILDPGPSDEARVCPTEETSGAIRQIRLQTAIERLGGEVDLLKLDCEGAEFEILQPAPFWEQVHHIRMEYHLYGGRALDEVKTALAALGYSIVRLDRHHAEAGVLWAARRK